MNKKKLILSVVLFAILLISFGPVHADELEISIQATFTLPLSLQVIEEDAFSDTAAEAIILPEGFQEIGDKVFAEMPKLTDVYIPETIEYISDSAFSSTDKLTIHGIADSYATEWASRHDIPFLVDDVWNVIILNAPSYSKINLICRYFDIIMLIALIALCRRGKYFERNKRPQELPELNPIEYCFP